jgi:long-subunit acyl-CoA synthetase (AMP-forming)
MRRAHEDLTVATAFRRTARTHPDEVAIRTLGSPSELTWRELLARVDRFAAGLAELGVRRGDVVAVLLTNRPEFVIADLAALTLGAAGFGLYATLPPEQIAAQLTNSGARVVVTEPVFLDAVVAARALGTYIKHAIVADDGDRTSSLRWDDVAAVPGHFDADAAASEVRPDDLITLIYTSGTTGPAKGVELTHRNVLASVGAVNSIVGLVPGDRVISWLPNAHIAERIAHYYLPVLVGASVTCCADARRVGEALTEVRPRWFFAVPRVWEKLRARIDARVASLAEDEREAIQAALARAIERVRMREATIEPSRHLTAAEAGDAQLLARLRAELGLDQAACVQSGAAPCPSEVVEFFHAIGLPLTEIWGMSETSAAGTMGTVDELRIGSVGRPLPGIELRRDDDGELLVRGPVVMRGYRGEPEKTAQVLQDGWLRTGDIATIDQAGFVRIIDRKKDIIINAAGKNMSPANIEVALKSAGPLIGQACVVGDGRPYNVALLVLDPETAPAWAANAGIDGLTATELATHPAVVEAIADEVAAANTHLARVEQIKRFHVVGGEWLPGGPELTPTMKLKRRPIAEKYKDAIDALYGAA